MILQGLWQGLENSALGQYVAASSWAFPTIETVHVIAIVTVVGSIAVMDLRLLGVASSHRPFSRVADDTLKWTWIAFILVAITGALMFTTNARVYADNTFFRIKLVLLALAGANMLSFNVIAKRTAHHWDEQPSASPLGRTFATLSIALWISIIFVGRMIGFTTTGAAAKSADPPPANVDFDAFLSGGPDANNTAGSPPAVTAPAAK